MGVETALIVGAVASTAGSVYTANQQKKSADRAISSEERRRAPFDATATDLSYLFRDAISSGDLARGIRPSNNQLATESRIRELLDNPFERLPRPDSTGLRPRPGSLG